MPQRSESVSTQRADAIGALAGGMAAAGPRATALLLGCLFAPLRFLLLPALTIRPQKSRRGPITVPATPFTLTLSSGRAVECLLRGEVRGGSIRLGEEVRVRGRFRRRDGVVEISELCNTSTGARAYGYVDPEARLVPIRTVASVIAVIFMAYVFIVFLDLMGMV